MSGTVKRIPILTALLLWASAAIAVEGVNVVYPDWFKNSLYDLQGELQDARNAGKQGIMVFFSTKTCSYCNAIIETAFKEKDIEQRLRKNYDVIGLEILSDNEVVDTQGKTHWAKDFAVHEKARFTPTMIFYGEGGQIQLRLVGYQSPQKFRGALDYLGGGHYARMTLRDFLSQHQTASTTAGGDKTNLNLDRRAARDKPLLVVFEAADCTKCQQLRSMLKAPLLHPMAQRFQIAYVSSADKKNRITTPDGKKQSGRQWADKLGLIYSPAMVFFNEQGKDILRVDTDILVDEHGNDVSADDAQILDNIRARLQFVSEKGYVTLPQFQRWRAQQNKRVQ